MSKFTLSAFADEIDQNLKTQMDVLDEHGIKHIEMRGVNGKNLTLCTIDEVKEIKKQMDDRGFALSAIGSPLGKIKITDTFAPHMELFKHTLEIAEIMKTKYIRLFSFFIEADDYTPYRDEVMERMTKFADAAKNFNVILLHENEKDIYGDTPERCADILKTLNSPTVRATFDPANFVQCGVDTLKAYELLKPYIEYVHIKDALFADNSVVPAGQGDGNVKEIIIRLKQRGYEGFLTLEPHLGSFDGSDSLEKDNKFKNLPDGGPRLFAIAVTALNKILTEV